MVFGASGGPAEPIALHLLMAHSLSFGAAAGGRAQLQGASAVIAGVVRVGEIEQ